MSEQRHISQSISFSTGSGTLTEQERTEYINTLDSLCAALEKISASLAKNSSEITDIYGKANNLLITGANEFVT
jgi:hypothetical protein